MFASFLFEGEGEEGDSTDNGPLNAMLIMNVSLMDLFEGEGIQPWKRCCSYSLFQTALKMK
jgi:hypothetical protein